MVGLGGEEGLVIDLAGELLEVGAPIVVEDDDVFDRRHLGRELVEERKERMVDEDDLVLGVLGDVREVGGVQAQIQRMHHRPHHRRGEVRLEGAG